MADTSEPRPKYWLSFLPPELRDEAISEEPKRFRAVVGALQSAVQQAKQVGLWRR